MRRRSGLMTHVMLLACVLGVAGCASSAGKVFLPELDPGSIRDRDQANAALAEVSRTRSEALLDWRRRERACYDRFFVTACLNKLAAERREADFRFKSIEIQARFILREVGTQERGLEEVRRLEDRQSR